MTRRAVWISTWGLYNSGHLIGRWHDLADGPLPQSVSQWLENGSIRDELIAAGTLNWHDVGEELWCFDIEGFPENVEMSPAEAQRIHDSILEKVEEYGLDEEVILAAEADGVDPETYVGTYDSFEDYAYEVADEYMPSDDSMLARYFDYRSFARDLQMDYSVVWAPGGQVYIFHL